MISWLYPADFLELMIRTTALLVRSKVGLCSFFESAGVPESQLAEFRAKIAQNRDLVRMTEISRAAIEWANQSEARLSVSREIVKRVVEFSMFDQCWPDKQDVARGLVSQVRDFVKSHTVATRYVEDVERERAQRQEIEAARRQEERSRQKRRNEVANELAQLFSDTNAHRRGKALEAVLNRLFAIDGVLIAEAFELRGGELNGVVEQLDGVIEFDSNTYLVEMKWWSSKLGPGDVAQHMLRVFSRGQARGVFIAYPSFTEAAILSVTEQVHRAPFILAELEEVIRILNDDVNVRDWLRDKLRILQIEKRPFAKYSK